MLLVHETSMICLTKIIKENSLKAACFTNELNNGDGIYEAKKQRFVFFNTVPSDYQDKPFEIPGRVVMYFDAKLLYRRSWWIATCQSPCPHRVAEWTNNTVKQYKRKYPQYYRHYNSVLNKLFLESVKKIGKSPKHYCVVFQQVAIKNKCNLDYLKKIVFTINNLQNLI